MGLRRHRPGRGLPAVAVLGSGRRRGRLATAVILAGAIWVLRPLGMFPMALSFLAALAVLIGVLAAAGQGFFAIWHAGPVTGLF